MSDSVIDLVSDDSISAVIEINEYNETTEEESVHSRHVSHGSDTSDRTEINSDIADEQEPIWEIESSEDMEDSNNEQEYSEICNQSQQKEENKFEQDNEEEMDRSIESLDEIDLDIKDKKKPELKATFGGAVIGDKQPIWSVQFNPYLPDGHNYFAAAGGDRITIYECIDDHKKPIRLVYCFADLNIVRKRGKSKRTENYYTVCWSYDDITGDPVVIGGGVRAIIRVINCATHEIRHLIGHGGAINDLKTSPHDHNLILSSSEDHSIRLWNIKTFVCVARFWGESGHRDQVICSDFYLLSDKYFVSAGMDHSIKVWTIDSKDVRQAIKESYEPQIDDMNFPMRFVFYPVYTNRDIHGNYIDCVQFFGKWILSKSLSNKIIMFKPDFLDKDKIQESHRNKVIENDTTFPNIALTMEDNEYWFVKFSMDFDQSMLAIGNSKGTIYLWDMAVEDPTMYEPLVLKHKKSKTCIRQTSFSTDGTILISVSENSSIYRWNIQR